MRKFGIALALLWFVAGMFVAQAALAIPYADEFGTNFSFTVMSETPSGGQFNDPAAVNDQLVFASPSFSASASGGGVDAPYSLFNATITSTGSQKIEQVLLEDFGDILLDGSGTAGTYAFVGISGTLRVTEVDFLPISAVDIPFGGAGDLLLTLPDVTAGESVPFSTSLLIDVQAIVANATKVELAFNNTLLAFSEVGTDAYVDKNSIEITVIPEPGTAALLCGGVVALCIRARSRRA
jgi:hypothetical protein